MFLSISIPVYNASQYLDSCINSIMNQTETDYELILVDDGSKDSSVEICEKWSARFPEKIRVIKKNNTGSLLTRRRCLEESKGEYIYIMDADDYLINNNVLYEIKNLICKYRCDLLFFNCTIDSKENKPYFAFPFDNETVFENNKLKRIYEYYISENGLKPLWNKVFKRNLVDWEEDYSQYKNITNGTDYFQSTPIVSNAKRIVYSENVYYYYRVNNNPNSIVHSFKPTVFYSAKENYYRMEKYAKKWCLEKNDLNILLCSAYMKLISTSIYKVRLIDKKNNDYRLKYLTEIGSDYEFREKYNIKLVKGFGRKALVFLLYHKEYKVINMLLKLL